MKYRKHLVHISVIAFAAAGLSACLGSTHVQAEPDQQNYTEKIPGTTVSFEMVAIPAGEISIRGKSIPIKPLYVSATEVTWDAYDIFVYKLDDDDDTPNSAADAISRPSRPYGAPDHGWGHAGFPALHMHYKGAEEYCKWLSAKTGHTYRMPTEAEWEYACRAGEKEVTGKKLSEVSWFGEEKTHAVGKKKPNAWRLYDTLGNVAEWAMGLDGKPVVCGGSYKDAPDKISPSSRAKQQFSWNTTDPQNPKSTWWLSDAPFVGFRIVRER
ncbi:MAG: SUMF1/EgtB/PvdO family nonheme iron enzyme [Armatimonadetes bacterium]|nr:SUMF1/EgtB/PvdO family nonheme iron enzyme [Armatimonadota bacterium]